MKNDTSKTFVLVSCGSKKLSQSAPARDLYTGDLFKKSRAFAEQQPGASWFVLSAKHGLLAPEQLIKPYNKTLNEMPIDERRIWAREVFRVLVDEQALAPGDETILLAGAHYCEFLVPFLRAFGVRVLQPLRGLGIGQRLAWLQKRLEKNRATQKI